MALQSVLRKAGQQDYALCNIVCARVGHSMNAQERDDLPDLPAGPCMMGLYDARLHASVVWSCGSFIFSTFYVRVDLSLVPVSLLNWCSCLVGHRLVCWAWSREGFGPRTSATRSISTCFALLTLRWIVARMNTCRQLALRLGSCMLICLSTAAMARPLAHARDCCP